MNQTTPQSDDFTRAVDFVFISAFSIFTLLFFANAWVGDDAYITFRTVDNFVNGYGLRWNVIERVQTYTHPLWMLLCIPPYYFTREAFYTAIVISFAVCAATLLLYRAWLPVQERWKAAVLIVVLLASKSFMDYSSSGLENCLSALWAILFVHVSATVDVDPRRLYRVIFVAALAYVTRQDTLLLYAPVCLILLSRRWRAARWSVFGDAALGAVPALAWTSFSVVYYGFPFPNTAYAKGLIAGIPVESRLKQGAAYIFTTALWDPLSLVIVLIFTFLVVRERSARVRLGIGFGIWLYVGYIITVAASSSTLALRFFSVPVALATVGILDAVGYREGIVLALIASMLAAIVPMSPVRTIGCSWSSIEDPGWGYSALVDMRFHQCKDKGALANFQRNESLPAHIWFKDGLAFRNNSERVHVSGPGGHPAMGYFGYAAGAGKTIIDPLGVTDPLMARLPATIDKLWLPGHISRPQPDGYLESLQSDSNLIVDPYLHQYFDSLRLITRGPLFALERWKAIFAMNFGLYSDLVRKYEARRKRYGAD